MHPLRSIFRVAAACLLLALFATRNHAQVTQAPAVQTAPAAAQVASSTSRGTVLQANANLVLIDIVVTERGGNTVHGLDKGRFHVFEDGREQTITSFDEHKPAELPASAARPVSLPPNTYSNVPLYPNAGAVNVLLLDGLNTPMADQMYVRQQMLQYMGKIQPGTSLAIFTLSSRLRLIEGFTTDVAQLTRALQSPKATPQTSVILDPQSNSDLDSATATLATLGANSDAVASMQQFMADVTAFQTDERVRMTLDAMQQLARYLSAIPGRKNLIWFSGSFPIALDPDDSLQSPFQAMRNYSDDIRETSELLSASRVAVYPVDARGLMSPPSASASYSPSSNLVGGGSSTGRGGATKSNPVNMPNVARDNLKFMQQTAAEHASMQQIAEQTGGKEYINTNGLKEAVVKAVENGSSYYTVGYVPEGKQPDGKFRKIQLRLDNANYTLAYRHGYYADATDKPSEHNPGNASLITTATLPGAPPSTQIQFRARVLPATDPLFQGAKLPNGPGGKMSAMLKEPIHRTIVDLAVDAHWFSYQLAPDGAHQAEVEFVLVAYDAEYRRVNYLDKGFQFNLKADQFARTMATGIPIRLALDLPEGRLTLRIAVHDLDARHAGSLEIPVTVAAK
jgi:VWFA-related protein